MADPKSNELMEKIVSLCKRRGFVFQSSDLYGGINGFWDYGPLGTELKRNVKDLWWRSMTRLRDDIVGLDATIIMHPQIWKASGHVDTFADLMVECPLTKRRFRADQIEPQSGTVYTYSGAGDQASPGQVRACSEVFSVLLPAGKPPESARRIATLFYQGRGIANPALLGEQTEKVENSTRFNPENGARLSDPRPFNLMFKTHVGPVADDENTAYLRPETAQAIFAQFKNVLETSRQKVPFGVAQVGKAFRNEVTPRNFTFRSREFEQMELEFFIAPDEAVAARHGKVTRAEELDLNDPSPDTACWGWEAWHKYWVEQRLRFYEGIGLPRHALVEYWQKPEELAHYARATVDILYKFPFSKRDEHGELTGEELEGVAARGDFDLSQHERFSGKSMGVFDEDLRSAWAKLAEEQRQTLRRQYYESRLKYLSRVEKDPAKAEQTAKDNADGLAKGQYIPHVIEPSAGVDRLVLALICNAYSEDRMPDEKGNLESRVVMRFHPRVAPVKAAVLPLLKNKPDLVSAAIGIRDTLRAHLNVVYDDAGAIGRRYRRQDEAGTPFCITVDFETLEGAKQGPLAGARDTVTIRHRDDGSQERIAIKELLPWLLERVG